MEKHIKLSDSKFFGTKSSYKVVNTTKIGTMTGMEGRLETTDRQLMHFQFLLVTYSMFYHMNL